MDGTGGGGPFLREWRKYHRVTLTTLGERLRVDHSALSKLETGKRKYLNPELIRGYAEALNMTQAELFQKPPAEAPLPTSSTPDKSTENEVLAFLADLTPEQRQIVHEIVRLLRSLF